MVEEPRRYVSYLLRLWQTERGGALIWRASLQSAHTGERRGFASLDDLYAFLELETTPSDTGEPCLPENGNVEA
jgi:hypothetical protein